LAPVRLGGDSDASDTDESYESESSEASSNVELDCADKGEKDSAEATGNDDDATITSESAKDTKVNDGTYR
jgi:hypothetical protein